MMKKNGRNKKMNKTKLKALTICLIIILTAAGLSVWASAAEPHGEVAERYTDSGGGSYTLYADGHLAINGYAGSEPEEGVILLADRVKSMELNDCVITADSRPLFKECVSLTSLDFTDTAFEGDMTNMFLNCKNLEEVRFFNVSTSAVTRMNSMFSGCSALKNIDLSGFDMSNVKFASMMFCGCESLKSIDMSGLDWSNVGFLQLMFQGCVSLERANLSGMNLTGCENMTQMFSGCTALRHADLSDITASDEMNAYQIFTGCRSLETADLEGFNFGKTSFYFFFHECPNLREVNFKGVDTSNVTVMNHMFVGCEKLKTLDLSDFDTGNVVSYHDMFSGCSGLEYLDVSGFDLTDTGNMMDRMFYGLVSLREINLTGFKTSGVTVMYGMFQNCKSLERLDLSGFDTSSVSNVGDMFTGCTSLKYLNVSGFDLSKVSSISGLFARLSNLERIDMAGFKLSTEKNSLADALFIDCKSLRYLDLSETELKNAVLYQAFNNVGFWELRLPETSKSGFPCFGGNTPPEKPYYTWDGDWSYYTDGAGTAVRDDVLQSSKDAASPEQICLDTVRIQNAGNAIRITPNFTPIEYPVTLHDKEILKHVSYNVEKLPYTPPSEYTDKEYYSFDGFSLTEDSPVIKDFAITLEGECRIGEISDLYLHYTPVRYDINISFVDGNGNVIASDVKNYSIEDKAVFAAINKDYAEGMCEGYGFVGFSSEKLGISDTEEIPAPEAPCGSIDITAVMELKEKETESPTEPPEDTEPESPTEPENTTEPSEDNTETAGPSETATSAPEGTGTPGVTIPEETTVREEPETSEEGETKPAKVPETSAPSKTETSPEEATPNVWTETTEEPTPEEEPAPGTEAETVPEPVPDASAGGTMQEASEDTTKPQGSTVNTGDSGSVFAVIMMGAAIVLFFIIWTAGRCIHQRKRRGGRREKKQM